MKVRIAKNIMADNNRTAEENRALFSEKRITCLNIMSGPGAGKTTILEKTFPYLKEKHNVGGAVIEGDVEGDYDGARLERLGVPCVQLNTQGACHLTATMIKSALQDLPLDSLDILVIENVGNLVCPAGFYLGEDLKVTVLSLPEGDDKPAKYPSMFKKSEVLLVNKIDLASLLEFSFERIQTDCAKLNPALNIIEVSAKDGTGIEAWAELLIQRIRRKKTD